MISGIYENCVGTTDLEATLKYWQELGYREVKRREFSAEQAAELYGHASRLVSVRLQNGNSADHGNLRIFWWEQPLNEGLTKTLPMVVGSRWFAQMCKDINVIVDAFGDDKANGGDWLTTEPARAIIGTGNQGAGLYNRFVGVREMFVIGKETRQAFFQRYGYTRPGYGTIEEASPMGVSEGTHSSLITADHRHINFYTDVFGLTATHEPRRSGFQNPPTRQTLMLEEGQEFYLSAFQSPKMIVGLFQVYSPLYPTADKINHSRPGSLGICLFTYKVDDINAFHAKVTASNATNVSPILNNEFGEPSFSLVAPDGYHWVILG
jgi:uncharacterized glyoxalase superfamily protein PhnB